MTELNPLEHQPTHKLCMTSYHSYFV